MASLDLPRPRLAIGPWILLTLLFLLTNGAAALRWGAGVSLPPGAAFLLQLSAIPVYWRLLEVECRPHKVTFPLDMGFFLYVAGFLILPYYLWRAQRWRGVGKILLMVGIWTVTYVLTVGLAWVLLSINEAE
jgi:hypothetical protein